MSHPHTPARTIRQVAQEVWPKLWESLERHKASRELIKANPNATPTEQARARRPWNRLVCEESVWTLAKAGYLATPEQAAVVEAAQAWAATYHELEEPEVEDRELYDAVQSLVASFEPLTDEPLELPPVD